LENSTQARPEDKKNVGGDMKHSLKMILVVFGLFVFIGPASAEGNLASRPTGLELTLNPDLSMSNYEYELETGKYYRWDITSNGGDEFLLLAPELWRNSWINQVAIGEMEVKPMGLYGLEFDDEGQIRIWFVPIRPGNYEFYIDGHKERGMVGTFIVR
jgi:uncharacterized cupredoxin-like copper-binding protein